MQEKTDRRILRTRHQLRDVLLDLAMQMPLESVTVKILTEHAGLNRGTFYLHYQDIHDFHEQLKNDILEEFHAIIKNLVTLLEVISPLWTLLPVMCAPLNMS